MAVNAQEISPQDSSSLKKREHFPFNKNFTAVLLDALLPYLGTRIILVLVGLLANFYILPLMISNPILPSHAVNIRFPQALWLMWQRFDSGFYLGIAHYGYWPASTLHSHSNWVFYPLYPLLISIVAFLFGGSADAFSLAGLLISNVAALIAVTFLYLLVRREFGRQIASHTALYLSLFPTSFYLSAIYPESLFMALSIACIYYARKHHWWLAGLCGGAASLTRAQGIMLLVPVAWEYWQVLSDRYAPLPDPSSNKLTEKGCIWFTSRLRGPLLAGRELRNWLSGLSLLLIPSGLFAFMIYAKIKVGDLLATFHANQWGWGRQLSYPWRLLIYSLRHPIVGEPMNWNFWVLNITLAFIFIGLTVWAFRRLPTIYALYTALMVLLPLSSNFLNSIGRYYLVVFSALILLAMWSSDDKPAVRKFVIISSFASLQAVFMIFYVLGLPVMA
jgi:dolichyl-phosphate-mannose-protein mannosyltransferase